MEKYLEHFSGDEAFCRMVMSLKEQVIDKNMWHLTPFYDPHEISVIQRLLGNQDDLKMYHYGGIECAEMQRVIIAPSFYTIIIPRERRAVNTFFKKYGACYSGNKYCNLPHLYHQYTS